MKIVAIVIITGVVGMLLTTLASACDKPDVFVSYSSEKCVKVTNYNKDDNFTCSNLPRIYNKVWVQ